MSDKGRFNPYRAKSRPWVRNLFWAAGVVLFVLGWHWIVHAREARLRKVAKELATFTRIINHPVPNYAGTQLLYARSLVEGVGVYLKDIKTGSEKLLLELPEHRVSVENFALLAWSPDDKLCALARPIKGKEQKMVFFNASDGTTNASPNVVGYIDQFCWLSTRAVAYLNNSNNIHIVTRASDGKWRKGGSLRNLNKTPITYLTAISPTTVAWKQDGAIWKWDVAGKVPAKLWEPETNNLASCHYSTENEKFIIGLRNPDKSFQIASFEPRTETFKELNRVEIRNVSKIKWINSGKGYAFQGEDHWSDTLFFTLDASPSLSGIFSEGDVREFRASRDKIFIYGSEGIEPAGVWEYELRTRDLRAVVRSTDKPLSFSKSIRQSYGSVTNGNRKVTYQIWRPESLANRKYPVILTQTPYRWSPYPNVAAAAGYYFVRVNRMNWTVGLENWESDVMAVYDELSKDPHVDLNRVFLYGSSAETHPISNLAAEKPALWKGIVVFSPGTLPDLSQTRLSTMWINAGMHDPSAGKRLEEYQSEAAARGVSVRLITHPNARHNSWSAATDQAKSEELAAFLAQIK